MRAAKLYTHALTRAVLMTLAFFVFIGATQRVGAATFTVNQTGDQSDGVCDANCTLRDAIDTANSRNTEDTIVFASPLFDTAQTINLTSAQLTISNPLTITGRGARLLTVRRAVNNPTNFRIFEITGAAAVVSISGITISNGSVPDGGGGGGVRNGGGTLLLNGVAVSGNTTTADGGGIGHGSGTTTILNSTVSGNSAGGFGGGIRVANGTLSIANSTVSGNSASSVGGIDNSAALNMNNVTVTNNSGTVGNPANTGGVLNFGGTVNTRNSIIAANTAAGSSRPDVSGTFASNGYNIVGSTPGNGSFTKDGDIPGASGSLAQLANYGGQTDTHRPLPGSEAIDAGNNCVVNQSCGANNPPVPLTTDQRGAGFPRQLGAAVDIGAVEAGSATFTVNQTGDAGDSTCDATCTLRDAITAANATTADPDTIVFASPLFDTAQTINLTSAQLTISNSLTITGRGARLLTVRRSTAAGTPNFRIFEITGAAAVGITGMTISNGSADGGGGILNSGGTLTLNAVAVSNNFSTGTSFGGGINNGSGTMTILNSLVSGNTATRFGGGIENFGVLNLANSTVSGNTAGSGGVNSGGGAAINNGGTLNMNNVTVTGNTYNNTSGRGATGGISSGGGIVNSRNTIIAGNAFNGASPDVLGGFTSNGNNLIGSTTGSTGFTQSSDKTGVAANLAALANYGGQTDTHRLLPGSPAIDAGDGCVIAQSCIGNNPLVALQTDQRGTGFARQFGSAADIGAFEAQAMMTAADVWVSGRVVTQSGRGIRNVVITMTDMRGDVRTARTGSFGYYRFEQVAAGETYVFAARGKRFFFEQGAQVRSILEETNNVDFVAGGRTVFSAN